MDNPGGKKPGDSANLSIFKQKSTSPVSPTQLLEAAQKGPAELDNFFSSAKPRVHAYALLHLLSSTVLKLKEAEKITARKLILQAVPRNFTHIVESLEQFFALLNFEEFEDEERTQMIARAAEFAETTLKPDGKMIIKLLSCERLTASQQTALLEMHTPRIKELCHHVFHNGRNPYSLVLGLLDCKRLSAIHYEHILNINQDNFKFLNLNIQNLQLLESDKVSQQRHNVILSGLLCSVQQHLGLNTEDCFISLLKCDKLSSAERTMILKASRDRLCNIIFGVGSLLKLLNNEKLEECHRTQILEYCEAIMQHWTQAKGGIEDFTNLRTCMYLTDKHREIISRYEEHALSSSSISPTKSC